MKIQIQQILLQEQKYINYLYLHDFNKRVNYFNHEELNSNLLIRTAK